MVEADLAELVDDDGGVGERRVVHQAVEQRGLAGAEEAGQHGERDGFGRTDASGLRRRRSLLGGGSDFLAGVLAFGVDLRRRPSFFASFGAARPWLRPSARLSWPPSSWLPARRAASVVTGVAVELCASVGDCPALLPRRACRRRTSCAWRSWSCPCFLGFSRRRDRPGCTRRAGEDARPARRARTSLQQRIRRWRCRSRAASTGTRRRASPPPRRASGSFSASSDGGRRRPLPHMSSRRFGGSTLIGCKASTWPSARRQP